MIQKNSNQFLFNLEELLTKEEREDKNREENKEGNMEDKNREKEKGNNNTENEIREKENEENKNGEYNIEEKNQLKLPIFKNNNTIPFEEIKNKYINLNYLYYFR